MHLDESSHTVRNGNNRKVDNKVSGSILVF